MDSGTIQVKEVQMRISELAGATGVTVPTIKYYLREGLLSEGARTSATQAEYGEDHVRRLRVVRALIESGVTVAETRKVVAALDEPPASPHDLLGAAHAAVTPHVEAPVDLGVHSGDEEGRHRVDPAQVLTVGRGLLEPSQVGVDDTAVTLEREDQRDVDADSLSDRAGDRR
jgi:DNA-binding transcriptional MerR regulator